jgi:uncharacterized membrane protein YbhN (UPF0104 family)
MTIADESPRADRAGRPGSDAGRDETGAERIDRNLRELMEELRVAIIGVQVLFAFLLALPFTTRFAEVDAWQRELYVADLLLAAFATALLIAPVAYHRLVFRRHAKRRLLFRANALAVAGLCVMGVAICGSILLVTSVIYTGGVAAIIATACAAVIFGLWLLVPGAGADPEEY